MSGNPYNEELVKVLLAERKAWKQDARSGNPAKRVPALAALASIEKKLSEIPDDRHL